jgi:hypothetical protein
MTQSYSKKRVGKKTNYDSQLTASNTYNDYAGGQKNISVGPVLESIRIGSTWSTDASTTALEVPAGSQVAIYNTSATAGVVRFGKDSTVVSGTVGSFDAEGSPSIPCRGQDWTYLCCGERNFIKTSANTLIVYILKDDTVLK